MENVFIFIMVFPKETLVSLKHFFYTEAAKEYTFRKQICYDVYVEIRNLKLLSNFTLWTQNNAKHITFQYIYVCLYVCMNASINQLIYVSIHLNLLKSILASLCIFISIYLPIYMCMHKIFMYQYIHKSVGTVYMLTQTEM